MNWLRLLPVDASSIAGRVDNLMLAMTLISGVAVLAISACIIVFVVRYRHGAKVDRSAPPAGNRVLETVWIVLPVLAFAGFFAWAAIGFVDLYRPPADAVPVFVVAKQWMWKLEHKNGRREIDELHVPVGRPVRLVMTSQDVIHSFYVPAFRLKQDVVPGRYTSLWFTPTRTGVFHLFCAEYCGGQHAAMRGRIVVMEPAEYARWLASGNQVQGIAAYGFEVFRRYGCSGCHNARSSVHAPDLNGLIGRTVHLQDGRSISADETYIRDSILLPRKDVVAGYKPVMPSFAGQISEEDLMAVIEYIRSTGVGGGNASNDANAAVGDGSGTGSVAERTRAEAKARGGVQ